MNAIETVKMLLLSMEKEVAPLKLREDCDKFFLELVSSQCFGRHSLPERELIKLLMNVVIKGSSKSSKTKKRIFLLRLLMEHK